jgi:hypothetical protein
MTIGRNDPCPCGSGKKYKRCCLGLDREAGVEGSHAGSVRSVAVRAGEWEADLVAMPAALDDPAARLAALLLVAEGYVLHSDVLVRPSPEAGAMAEAIAEAVAAAGEKVGALPKRVKVRDIETAAALPGALAKRLGDAGPVPDAASGKLPGLDEAAFALAGQAAGEPRRFLGSFPEVWSGWGFPGDLVPRLFRLAAAYHRAAPWALLPDHYWLEAAVPAGGVWTAVVLGNAGREFGLALYSERADFEGMFAKARRGSPFDDLAGRIVTLSFDRGADLPRAMRREVAAAGWEVAGAEAYPRLHALNTPAGGIRLRDAEDLAALLGAIPRMVVANRAELEAGRPVEAWRDEETGAVISCRQADPREPFEDEEGPFEPLAPGRAEGPNAEPEAALEGAWTLMDSAADLSERERAVVDRFERHLSGREGLSAATAARHSGIARGLVDFLAGTGVPVRALHEHDLRDYLFDWYPRKSGDGAAKRTAVPGSLRRFFDYLAAEDGIVCPWAFEILDDRHYLLKIWDDAPTGPFWDDDVQEWRNERIEDLVDLVMIPDSSLGEEEEEWGSTMATTEARLHAELVRRWLLWRDELLDAGVVRWRELADRLIERQREWERTPHPRCAGKSPIEAILEERAGREGGAGG